MGDVYDDPIDDKTFNATLDHPMLFKLPATIRQVKDEFKIEAGKPFKTVDPQGKLSAIQNIQRLMLNVGRMCPKERSRRMRQIKADQINMECISDKITESGTARIYLVQPFSRINIQH
ncbi:hypothetical protein RMCBS344292_08920 [Rhizopus microsporus]|nr:hypothetical protein RMCBS344292_08920 [Rhizopus microsporus]